MMFSGCSNLKKINVIQYEKCDKEELLNLFTGCKSLSELIIVDKSDAKDKIMYTGS